MIWKLQGLDKPIRCRRRGTEPGTQHPYSLMMMAVDADLGVLQDFGEKGARVNLHLVAERPAAFLHLIMFNCPWQLIWKMRVQCATQAHVHNLAASANAQKRLPVLGRRSQET